MAIDLATKFEPYVDEKFTSESKKSLITNNDFSWTGAHTVKVYKVNTVGMNDYDRNGAKKATQWSRYGEVSDLDAATEEFTLTRDRSFTFAIDKLDADETKQQVQAAKALERQQREVVIPEVDSYVYRKMAAGAGTKPTAKALTVANIYDEIITANATMDDAEVPETSRYLILTPSIYLLLKKNTDIMMDTDIAAEMRLKGVVSMIDGVSVIKVPAARLPENFGFMLVHPCATVAPTKLEDYKVHENAPGISGALVEGRICYDAFVLDNKEMAIYYQENATA